MSKTHAVSSYLGQLSTPDQEGWAAIGRVVGTWSLVEHLMDELLARLAGAPSFPALALIDKLTSADRAEAAEALLDMHRLRYGFRKLSPDQCDAIEAIFKEASALRARRNEAAHWVWYRTGEGLFAHRFRGEQAKENARTLSRRRQARERNQTDYLDGHSRITTAADLHRIADRMIALSDRLLEARSFLPEVPEAPR